MTVKKMMKTYYKSPDSGVPMAAKVQRMLALSGGEICAVATLPTPAICCLLPSRLKTHSKNLLLKKLISHFCY